MGKKLVVSGESDKKEAKIEHWMKWTWKFGGTDRLWWKENEK